LIQKKLIGQDEYYKYSTMHNNVYHRYLKLPFTYPKPERFNYPADTYAILMDQEQVFGPFRDWVKNLGLTISNVLEGFYTKPNGSDVPLHADPGWIPGTHDICKLNFTWGPSSSTTRWYKIKDESKYIKRYIGKLTINEKFHEENIKPDVDINYSIIANWEDVDLVHEAVIDRPSLINVGQLHSTWNPSPTEHRWTLCFVLLENNEPINFQRALEIFKDYIELESK
jgi:hypothetical protein